MKKAVRVVIVGTVQGVFFRKFVKDSADSLNLKGLVRNLDDGTLEAIFEGDAEAIMKMLEICKTGPKFAQIRSVKAEERKYSGDFKDFTIIRF